MSIETLLVSRLTGFAGLSALVGSRVRPGRLTRSDALPAVTFQRISAERVPAMVADTGIVRARFEFNCWAEDTDSKGGYQAVREVAEQVRLALQRWSSSGPPVVQDVEVLNELDVYESETETWRAALDFRVTYEE